MPKSPSAGALSRPTVDIAIFAHNEAGNIPALVATLGQQDIWDNPAFDVRILMLANGCTDDTVMQTRTLLSGPAYTSLAAAMEIKDLTQGGKSRTVNRFIHAFSRTEADMLCFMDADIELPDPSHLTRMFQALWSRPELMAFNSRPIKDLAHKPEAVGPIARLITMGGGTLDDFRTSICGQLYVMRTDMARRINLPAGLPVEDGFMRAMIVTDLFRQGENLDLIDGDPTIFHVYESLRTVGSTLRHQIRIVIGGAVNNVVFDHISKLVAAGGDPEAFLQGVARDENWLADSLQKDLPRAPYGYVPYHFALKRLQNFHWKGVKGVLVMCAGLTLDVASWIGASWHMMRRNAAGFW